jgi:hypothetical protein
MKGRRQAAVPIGILQLRTTAASNCATDRLPGECLSQSGSDALRLPPGPGRVDALVMRAFYRRLWMRSPAATPGVMGE